VTENVPPFPVDAPVETPPPTPPPDGTTKTTFWQSGGAKAAIVVTAGLGLALLRGLITGTPPSRESVAVMVEGAAWAWLAALGISRIDSDALRWQ
jgi:hypothetical protein